MWNILTIIRISPLLLSSLSLCIHIVHAQAGSVTWGGAGNTPGVGTGAWSNAQAGGMHPPGSLGNTDAQYSYGYAGVDSRGPYGGAGGNGGYYVSGTDEHGRPFSYNGGAIGGQPGQPGYPNPNNPYGYRSGASVASMASLGIVLAACTLALLGTSS